MKFDLAVEPVAREVLGLLRKSCTKARWDDFYSEHVEAPGYYFNHIHNGDPFMWLETPPILWDIAIPPFKGKARRLMKSAARRRWHQFYREYVETVGYYLYCETAVFSSNCTLYKY